METERQVIEGLRSMPEGQKSALAMQATIQGVSIERNLVPFLVTLLNGIKAVMPVYFENRGFLK